MDKKDARKEHLKLTRSLSNEPNTLSIYTDGSKTTRAGFSRCGAAATAYNKDVEVFSAQMGLGGHTEVYDAEMAALVMGATKAAEYIVTHPNITKIAFFTDNSAAATAMADPKRPS
jgi:ribonuclease HI